VILAATAAVAMAYATVRLGALAVARLAVARLGVGRRAVARSAVARRVLRLQLLRLLRAVTTGRRRAGSRGRGRRRGSRGRGHGACAHAVAVRQVCRNCGSRDVDGVLTAVTGLVTDVHLFLTVAEVPAVGLVAGRRGLVRGGRRGGRRGRARGGVSLVLKIALLGLGFGLLVVRGLSFAVAGRRCLRRGRLGLGRARGRLALCRAGRDLREADACGGGERKPHERAD